MTTLALIALVPQAIAQVPDGAQVPEALDTTGWEACTALSGIFPFFPAEASHVYGVRVPVEGTSRFEVNSVFYSLIDAAGIPGCNGARSHRLDVWVQSSTSPDADPDLQFSTVLTPTPSGGPNDFYDIPIDAFLVEPGDQIFVGFEMTTSAADDALCVMQCAQGANPPVAGEHFWSNAATTPYAWADLITDFGFTSTPLVRINGQRLLVDPTATIGAGVQLGAGVVIGVDAELRDRCTLGDGAQVGSDATIGYDATVGAGAAVGRSSEVRDRAEIGEDSIVGASSTVGYDSDVGARTAIGDGTTIGDRAQIGDDVIIGAGVTLGNDVTIEDGAEIGGGSILQDRAVVGAGATLGTEVLMVWDAAVGAGATVADGATVR
ncbi:MAG: hypothetical protein KTR31_38885 [Myxococcales bacterium]|nr:hypothetical protein [Myxococcales bacterium]